MQLDLLAWQQPCRLLVFPVKSRVGRIRQAAQSITSSRSDREAEHRWKTALGAVRRSLEAAGVSDPDMKHHLSDFLVAVDLELAAIRSPWRLRAPDDAETGGAA